ncbi:hypothetical protein LWC34_30290 [Kibdelosporangium philippinense]|uniref:Uncharacterized protein n=1 Tax=Kibdelosporangium philippinense TaxID=211113 RepID=A0ABS8ZGZ4_9PSEU|nr:hypothetical protein [Kibdelosporangium philippinense]MCE7007086.1 hypothetical protein [Kibdelosporangium philippinense]
MAIVLPFSWLSASPTFGVPAPNRRYQILVFLGPFNQWASSGQEVVSRRRQ